MIIYACNIVCICISIAGKLVCVQVSLGRLVYLSHCHACFVEICRYVNISIKFDWCFRGYVVIS